MDEKENLERLVNEKYQYLTTWVERYQKAQEALPFVTAQIENTEWEKRVIENLPDEADEISSDWLLATFERDVSMLKVALPMLPITIGVKLVNSTAISTSGTSDVFTYVARVGDLLTPDTIDFERTFTAEYQQLQYRQNRINDIRQLITNSNTLERFELAVQAFSEVASGVGRRTAAANEIRNLILGVNGDLTEKARKSPRENMSWQKIGERLVNGEPKSIEYQEFLRQENTKASLLSRLADVLKDREGGSLTNLDHIWTQVCDHLFVILSLTK